MSIKKIIAERYEYIGIVQFAPILQVINNPFENKPDITKINITIINFIKFNLNIFFQSILFIKKFIFSF